MCYILHIDTSADNGFVALTRNGQPLQQSFIADQRNQAAVINTLIDELLRATGVSLSQLDAIAVIGGPGSYTGLRIGLSTAKGLCYALGKPLMVHNKLLLLALSVKSALPAAAEYFGGILKAREEEYFITVYSLENQPVIPAQHLDKAAVIEKLNALNGMVRLNDFEGNDLNEENKNIYFTTTTSISFSLWSSYAMEQFRQESFSDLATAEPFYLKQVYTHNTTKN